MRLIGQYIKIYSHNAGFFPAFVRNNPIWFNQMCLLLSNNLLYLRVFCSWFKRSTQKKQRKPDFSTSFESTQVPLTDSEWAGLPSTRANYVSFSQQLPNPLLEGRNRNARSDDDVEGFPPPKFRLVCLWESPFFQGVAGWWNIVNFVQIGGGSILRAFFRRNWSFFFVCFSFGRGKVIDHLFPFLLMRIGIKGLTIHQSDSGELW